MAQNKGILVSAAIRPNDTLDPIATAYASEIMGGLHTASNTTDRNAIIFERREWGMMCYVTNQDKTYQLKYGYSSTNIMDNTNWVEFSGSGGGGGTEWIDSVIEVRYSQPSSPTNGDRYLVGLQPGDVISGANWATYSPGIVVQWNSSLSKWDFTTPTDGMSVRVDNEDNAIYKYQGNFPTGAWEKEKSGQVRDVSFTTANGLSFSATTEPPFDSYTQDMIFLAKFSTANIGNTMSVDINSMGSKLIKKPTPSGVVMLNPSDIIPGVVYSLVYDGTQFQLNRPYVNEDLFNVKYYIEPNDYIMIPPYYQYWVYSDLTVDGTLVNYGQVIIANGGMIMGVSGSFQNYGQLAFVNFAGGGMTTSFYDTSTIQFTQSNTIFGLSVSAVVKDGSLTASKLSTGTNGGATAGYYLSVDNNGDFAWSPLASTEVGNGLSLIGGTISLGGTLSQTTTIDGAEYDLTIGNVDTLLFTASTFDVEAEFVSIDAGSGNMQLIANGDVSVVSTGGEISLVGSSGVVTIGNGEGLVYGADYSATFVTQSLVTKGYVDAQLSSSGAQPEYSQRYLSPLSTSVGLNFQPTGITISYTPSDYSNLQVVLNGQFQYLGNGINSTASGVECYFSSDSGLTAKTIFNVSVGDELYWNGFNSGFELTTTDKISIVYEK